MPTDPGGGLRVLGRASEPSPPPEPPKLPVIPIIFLPGIMGSNLRVKAASVAEVKRRFEEEGKGRVFTPHAWQPPSVRYSLVRTVASALLEAAGGNCQAVRMARAWDQFGPKLRQVLLNPETVEVDERGFLPKFIVGLPFMDGRGAPTVARERGWGSVYWDSYWPLLKYLEQALNPWFRHDPASIRSRRMHVEMAVLQSESLPRFDWVRPTGEQVERAVQCRYPVHAVGYNWTQSNRKSADEVLARIEAWVQGYQDQGATCGKVILVTHSMGGLVARMVSQLDQQRKQLVLGVVHGVMPATGAPVAYRRMVAGTEHDSPPLLKELRTVFPVLAGRTAAETTPVMANAPGALELLPSHLYPPRWLKVECDLGQGNVKEIFSFPESQDPYREIYRQKDVWWRLVDPDLLDPAGIGGHTEHGYDPEAAWKNFLKRMNDVEEFHRSHLSSDQYHKPSHYFFAERIDTFATVRWRLPPSVAPIDRESIRQARHCRGEGKGSRDLQITQRDALTGKVVDGNMHFGTKVQVPAVLQGPDGAGDGTVPVESAEAPSVAIPHGIAADEVSFDHTDAYKSVLAQIYTLLAICRLAGSPTL